jgi:hypothetical protein
MPLPPLEREVLLPSSEASLRGEFWTESGVVRGHVEWARTCRRGVVREPREVVVRKSEYSRPAGVAMGAGSLAVGSIGLVLVARAPERSAELRCQPDDDNDGYDECSSPRETQLLTGVVLVGGAIALGAGSV